MHSPQAGRVSPPAGVLQPGVVWMKLALSVFVCSLVSNTETNRRHLFKTSCDKGGIPNNGYCRAIHFTHFGLTNETTLKHAPRAQNATIRPQRFLSRQQNINFAYSLLYVLNVHQLLLYRTIILTSKFLTKSDYCPCVLLTYNRRLNYHLCLTTPSSPFHPQMRTNYGFFLFTYIAQVTWNALSISLTAIQCSFLFTINVGSYIVFHLQYE